MLSQIRNQNHQGAQKGPSQIKTFISSSSTLAWKIPWTEEPGRLQSMGSLRVWHNWATSLSLFTKQLHDYKESWAPKSCCFWTVVLDKTLESPLDCKEIQPVHLETQSWKVTGRADDEAETPILWPPDARNWLIWKDPDAEKGWRWKEREQQMMRWLVGWHHWLNGHEFE